mmetsp:Transcript_64127/g.185889  ORF Transcript_64127/g.185889 Transcript_64127/m.185889 type:complete len:232 (-) Transcript_64127:291-986(-)
MPNGDETKARPMQPRNFVDKLPMRHEAISAPTPSTVAAATDTPSNRPSSGASVKWLISESMEIECGTPRELSLGSGEGSPTGDLGDCSAATAAPANRTVLDLSKELREDSTVSKPGGGLIDDGADDDAEPPLAMEAAFSLFFRAFLSPASLAAAAAAAAVAPGSTCSARSNGKDLAFPGNGGTSSSVYGDTFFLKRACSKRSRFMSSNVFIFHSSNSSTFPWRAATWPHNS